MIVAIAMVQSVRGTETGPTAGPTETPEPTPTVRWIEATATPAPGSSSETEEKTDPEVTAENAIKNVFLDTAAWRGYIDPLAVDEVDQVRRDVLAQAQADTLTVSSIEWADATPSGHTWTGNARVQFTDTNLTIELRVTLDFVDQEQRVAQLVQVEPG
ncbi:hypothetical protein [Microbacterium sp.]|uniref:hypothetical protein n=1 Tax=Microbacterium sp. TaxID=51671 RepID=UPI003F9D4701